MKRFLLLFPALLCPLAGQPYRRLVDAHVHHNGDPKFLEQLVARLDQVDGMAFLMVEPKDFDATQPLLVKYRHRLVGFGEIQLDDPKVLDWIERFHNAGFPGLGEISGPLRDFHDKSYWPVYERAEKYGMILLFHTGIVNRQNADRPADISSERMRVTTLDNIARRFPKLTIIGAHLGNPDYAWAAELAFERIIFGSDVFGGELEELDRSLDRYRKMLDTCGVSPEAQANIFGGTLRKILRLP